MLRYCFWLSVVYWSPARLFIGTGWTLIDEYMHTYCLTHEHKGTCARGLSFGQEIFVTATLRWKRRCVCMCVRGTFSHWCLTTDSLSSYYYPSILHGGTTLLLHVFVHSWTTQATTPSLIIAFHLSSDTETRALVLTSPELNSVVVFRYMHYCIVFNHVILVFHLLGTGVCLVLFYVLC